MNSRKYIPADISKITVNLDPAFIAGIKLEALFKLNDQNKFNKYCSRKIELFKQGSEKWFLFMEYWLLLLLKSENYNEAVTLYKKIKNNTGFNKIGPDIKERWLIYRSYLCFISNCKEIQWGFNIDKFARLKPDSNKQNIAYNIAFLIIRFLFSLREGNINEVKEYVEKLQNYSSFHLDKRHNYRNSIFIRMLSLVITNNFEYDLINERVSVYYQKLVENKVIQYISDEMEVIPYEKLWSIIKNILKTNKHFIHFRFYHFTEA